MVFDPEFHHRRSIRLKGYDYSKNGAYFVTICVKGREHLLGSIKNKNIALSPIGEIVSEQLKQAISIRKEIDIDSFVIMPNHIHLIVFIVGANGNLPWYGKEGRAKCLSPLQMRPRSLSSFMVGFKSSVSRRSGFSIWQRNYYDRIIRNEMELKSYRKYINDNPAEWEADEYYV